MPKRKTWREKLADDKDLPKVVKITGTLTIDQEDQFRRGVPISGRTVDAIGGTAKDKGKNIFALGLVARMFDLDVPKLEAMLKSLKAQHIVMGHTVVTEKVSSTPYSITSGFDGDVFLIDTGMLTFYFHGRPSALEIAGGRFTAVYASGDQVVLLNPKGGQASPSMAQPAEGTSQR